VSKVAIQVSINHRKYEVKISAINKGKKGNFLTMIKLFFIKT